MFYLPLFPHHHPRPLTRSPLDGADSPNHAPDGRARHRAPLRPPLVRPGQGRAGLGRERPRRQLHLRCRRGDQVSAQARSRPDLPRPPGGGGRLRVLRQAPAGHPLQCAQLLRRVRQRRGDDVRRRDANVFLSSKFKCRLFPPRS